MSKADDQRIDRDLQCVKCGYNLRTKSWNEQCPECGAAVVWSLRRRKAAPPHRLCLKLTMGGLAVLLVPLFIRFELFGVNTWVISLFVGLGLELGAYLLSARAIRRLKLGVRWTNAEFTVNI